MQTRQPPAMPHAPSHWTADHVAAIAAQPHCQAPLIRAADIASALPGLDAGANDTADHSAENKDVGHDSPAHSTAHGETPARSPNPAAPQPTDRKTPSWPLDLWDMWPLALRNGAPARLDGTTLWFALAAPKLPDPADRHAIAHIRLLARRSGAWADCGPVFPPGFAPGNREWSGSAILEESRVTLFFTAAGERGAPPVTVRQRLFLAEGELGTENGRPRIAAWSPAREIVQADGVLYTLVDQPAGKPGEIKAFRDPAYFRDPADGREYVAFAASHQPSPHAHNGMVGLALAEDAARRRWRLLPPILLADGVNNELERPCLIHRGGLYYLFWSTQAHVFAPGITAPTGLYGMAAPALAGPYRPLNGTGLVFANPEAEPTQAYSWWVMPDLSVISFVDYWGMQGRGLATHPELLRSQFGGVPAPTLQLELDGYSARLA